MIEKENAGRWCQDAVTPANVGHDLCCLGCKVGFFCSSGKLRTATAADVDRRVWRLGLILRGFFYQELQ